ncbi:extracellular solute-binding protein [Arthrobacter oryzae]|uniref:Extracellular solute-binding protein n=1 Tax=Arthrobacter oryzae TaxID=409290 RepID=A0A3N0BVZ7_9MICC|nr:extracellular solute-binding protein [Arthrobacter oryzae]RNL53872.1 extracellular solute-binding protein [Arthrobacter oryzae]
MRGSWKSFVAGIAAAAVLAVPACSAGSTEASDRVLKVAYQKTDSFAAVDDMFTKTKKDFEAANPGVRVELQPIMANDEDYGTKLALALRSPETAPDVFYEDSFKVRADAEAGYLLKLDERLAAWEDWAVFSDAAKTAGAGDDGGTYAVPLGTDTRAIWYNKKVLQGAGIDVPWQPRTWDDILAAARTIKASDAGLIPFSMYAGKGSGEGTVMQSFYELLYGTGDTLYDEATRKWVVGSKGFIASLEFLQTLYSEGLAVTPAQALDGNVWKKVVGEWLPEGRMGGTVEGSYAPSFWQPGGSYEWPGYAQDMGVAKFPTRNGQAPGAVSMSGGWTLAVSADSSNPDLAFGFLTSALNKQNSLAFALDSLQIAVRGDVAAEPAYQSANPFIRDVSELVDVTHFRPSTADYPRISAAIQEATESVITGTLTPEQAAARYDEAVRAQVGDEKVVQK